MKTKNRLNKQDLKFQQKNVKTKTFCPSSLPIMYEGISGADN